MKSNNFEYFLPNLEKPFRYLGCEFGNVRKEFTENMLRFALVSPETYELGMSHLGLKILYKILNDIDDVYAERFFAPWVDAEAFMRKSNVPLISIETETPLQDFDIIGFSILYEMSYTNILNMLNLAGIPFLAKDRDSTYPLIIAGGPAVSNPEPIANFFDAVFIGDGEEGIIEVVDSIRKNKKATRDEQLLALSEIEGVYVPSFFEPRYENGAFAGVTPQRGKEEVRRRVLQDLEKSPYPTIQPVPYGESTHNRLAVEISRGCTRGCRFCQAGFIYRPVRERNPQTIYNIIDEGLAKTGYDEVSLMSLSSGDYTLLSGLLSKCSGFLSEKISISMPSVRAGTVSKSLLEEIKKVRRTGFTIAPEAGSQSLRDKINKGVTEEAIMDTCRLLFEEGWELIKLYFMIGLPGETQEDIEAIVDLVTRIRSMGKTYRRVRLNIGISSFVPKPHTPFQWSRQNSIEEMDEKLAFLKTSLRMRGVQIKWQNPKVSFAEGIFSRGDRGISAAIVRAWEMGARFDGWTERFDFGLWMRAFEELGIRPETYMEEKQIDSHLPWEHINVGVSKSFMEGEWKKSKHGFPTPDCRAGACCDCGVCGDGVANRNAYDPEQESPMPKSTEPKAKLSFRYRLVYKKEHRLRFLSHLEVMKAFFRTVRRAGLPMRYSEGYNPHPKFSLGPAISLGMESMCEMMDLEMALYIKPEDLQCRLNSNLPPELSVLSTKIIPGKTASITATPAVITYTAELMPGWEENCNDASQAERIGKILAAIPEVRDTVCKEIMEKDELIIEKKKIKRSGRQTKSTVKRINIRPCLELVVAFEPNKHIVKPGEVLQMLFSLTNEDLSLFLFRKTGYTLYS